MSEHLNFAHILIQGDSQLVIKQLKYEYMCNSEVLGEYCQEARLLLRKFSNKELQHIDRKHNWKCDKLAKEKILQVSGGQNIVTVEAKCAFGAN